MRHRKAGKKLDRRDQERVALYRNLTISLIERFGNPKEFIFTTVAKAKAVRPFAEKIVTHAIKSREALEAAAKAANTTVDGLRDLHVKGDEQGKRKKFKDFSPEVREKIAASLHHRRLALSRLRHEPAVKALIEKVAPRFIERKTKNHQGGGYLRILRTSQWVLGDGSTKAILGWVGGEGNKGEPAPRERKGATVGAK